MTKLQKCFDGIDEIKETKGLTLRERTQTHPSDEYYTLAEDVERIEEVLRPYLQNRTIWCPFDAEWSAFTKVLKAKGYDVINTADDYKNHLKEIKEKGAIVFSNPPFSIWRAIVKDFQEYGIDFFLLNNLINAVGAYKKGVYGMCAGSLLFNTSEGQKSVPCFIMSNKDIRGLKLRKPQKEIDGIPFYTINGWVLAGRPTPAYVPSTFVLSEYAKIYNFEITNKKGYFNAIYIKEE